MKKILSLLLGIWLLTAAMIPAIPTANAHMEAPELVRLIHNRPRRQYVTAMLNYYLTNNTAVQETLRNGYSAMFLFDGASDNMDDARLSDLSYYRVSGVCLLIRLDENQNPCITYFSDLCSTLPDRPLDYGAWNLEGIGAVGPATVCDGTYELYSVYHAGAYEALNIRMNYSDPTADAVYMMPAGHTVSRATYINIHTRNVNHILQKSAWSSGCMLVGDGDFEDFQAMIDAAYDSNYERFLVDQHVGTVTVNRMLLRSEMLELYRSAEAVDTILACSAFESPQVYLDRCTDRIVFSQGRLMEAVDTVNLMSLPCSAEMDCRSLLVGILQKGGRVDICGSIVNTEGQLWYEVKQIGSNAYVPADMLVRARQTWIDRMIEDMFT